MINTDNWKIIAGIGIELHPDRVNAIADKIAGLSSVDEFYKASSGFGPAANKAMMNALEKEWKKDPGGSPLELVAALRAHPEPPQSWKSMKRSKWSGQVRLQEWSHPDIQNRFYLGCKLREMAVLRCQLCPYDIDSVKKALQDAVGRNVKIDILLESPKSHGKKINIESIDAFKKAIPSANVYAWNSETKSSDRWNGAVHAKCAVADDSLAFITSANLTRAAMENNMEVANNDNTRHA